METDYISRKAAIKKFEDAEYLYDPEQGAKRYTVEDAKEILNDVPAAAVRPVVYCRDCRFWGGRNGKNECSLITSLADPRIWLKTQPDDFCSSGERRDGGDANAD